MALQAGVPTLDFDGNPLGIDTAIMSLGAGLDQLQRDGFDTPKLQETFQSLQSLQGSQQVIRHSIPLTTTTKKARKNEKV